VNGSGWGLYQVGTTNPGSEGLEIYRATLKSGDMSQVTVTMSGNMYNNIASPPTLKFYNAAGKLLKMLENGVEVNEKTVTANGTQVVNSMARKRRISNILRVITRRFTSPMCLTHPATATP
jgi:hypothetical protein